MKSMFQKRSAPTIILMLILVLMTSTALAAISGGKLLDLMIPNCDSTLEHVEESFPGSCSVSEESMLGKAGTVFINVDKSEIRIIGEDMYRKYTFKESKGLPFPYMTGTLLYVIDSGSLTDYGVNIYLVENKDTKLLDKKEISTLAAQFVTVLNQ